MIKNLAIQIIIIIVIIIIIIIIIKSKKSNAIPVTSHGGL
jgi:preprotein translocase subunit SecG